MFDVLYGILCHLHSLTGLVASPTDVTWEPRNMSKLFPTCRPADIALHLCLFHSSPYRPSPIHDVAIDIMITLNPSTDMDIIQQKTINIRCHMSKESLKSNGMTRDGKPGHALIMDLMDCCMALIPATVSPFGKLGPLFRCFLYGKSPMVVSYDNDFFNQSNRPDTAAIMMAKSMTNLALTGHLNKGILSSPNMAWCRHHGLVWYNNTYVMARPRLGRATCWRCPLAMRLMITSSRLCPAELPAGQLSDPHCGA